MHPRNTDWSHSVSAGQRDLILLFPDEHIHEMWKSVRSTCWLWLDHILDSFLDSKPGDAATGVVFCQTSKYWKNAGMDVLCLNRETWAGVIRACTADETRCLLELGDKEEFIFFTKCNRFTDLTSVALQSQSMFGDWCAQPNSYLKYHIKLEWIYLYQKSCCIQRGEH